MAQLNDVEAGKLNLSTPNNSTTSGSLDEKNADKKSDSVEVVTNKEAYLDAEKESQCDGDGGVVRLNGEPVITTGEDVSRFVVDLRDDGEPALTFRSLFLGSFFAGLGAALCQVGVMLHSMFSKLIVTTRFTYINLFK
jgi:hypothetical protein